LDENFKDFGPKCVLIKWRPGGLEDVVVVVDGVVVVGRRGEEVGVLPLLAFVVEQPRQQVPGESKTKKSCQAMRPVF
jgi:hypothetical protein